MIYFDQRLDHYSEINYGNKTFKQKVLINEDYMHPQHKRGHRQGEGDVEPSPIFMYTGNEGPIDGFYTASGFVLTLAKKYKASIHINQFLKKVL